MEAQRPLDCPSMEDSASKKNTHEVLNFMTCSRDYVHADATDIFKYLAKTRDGILTFKADPLRRHSCKHVSVHAEAISNQKNERERPTVKNRSL